MQLNWSERKSIGVFVFIAVHIIKIIIEKNIELIEPSNSLMILAV